MKHRTVVRALVILLVVGLLGSLLAASGCKRDPEPETPPVTESEAKPDDGAVEGIPTSTEGTTESSTGGNTDSTAVTSTTEDGSAPAGVTPNAPTTLTVRLYWVYAGENALGVERTIPYTKAVATASLNALIAGPTAQEMATWPALGNAIPPSTKVLGIEVANGVAKVNLSKDFESGGGTFSVTARLAQIVYTLDQFPTIDAVEFYIDGKKVEMFSSEGLILKGPQKLDDYANLLPIDA